MTPRAAAALFGARALLMIGALDARLVPDTSLYAHGYAAWSSPLLALSGAVAGRVGVDVVAIGAAVALGWIVTVELRRNGCAHERARVVGLWCSPPGWFTAFAAADGAGAAAAVAALRRGRRPRWIVLAAACHLEAGLVALCVVAARRLGVRRLGAVALLAGVAACVAQWHLQTRYLLPGAAVAATRALPSSSKSRVWFHALAPRGGRMRRHAS